MIIGIVTETYWPDINGVAMTLNRLVSGLLDKGHAVQLICPHSNDRYNSQLSENLHYLPVKGFPIPGYKEASFGMPSKSLISALWAKRKPDVVYVATEGPLGWSTINLAKDNKIPVLSGFHTNFHSYSRYYKIGFLEKLIKYYLISLHQKTQSTIVPTEYQRSLVSKLGIANVSIIGRGVDCELFTPDKRNVELRRAWGVEDQDPVLLYVGRIAPEKNLDLAIKAFYSIYELNTNIKFVLVGSGPLTQKLQSENPQFIFVGNKTGDELAAYYASSDIFLFPSLTETFGNVVIEAMASGLGVVAYDYAAAGMHIKNRQNGVLAEFDHPEEFISYATHYIQNIRFLQNVRNNARNYAITQSWSSIVDRFEELLTMHSNFPVSETGHDALGEVKYEG